MAKPFVSHDGADKDGVRAEVYVQTGTGTIARLEEKGKNVKVWMSVEGLQHAFGGWTSKEEAIYPLLVAAHDAGRDISYRIESQRKADIDRSLPIGPLRATMELGNKNTNVLFVGIDGNLSSEAVTDPAEDPNPGGRIPATAQRNNQQAAQSGPAASGTGSAFSAEQALKGLAAARQGGLPPSVVDAAAALALAAGASVEQVLAAGVQAQEDPQRRPVQRVVAKEAAPYVAFNTDSRPNLGSYAIQAAVGAESLAADLMTANAVEVAEKHNAAVLAGEVEGEVIDPAPVNFRQAAALAQVLLDLADTVQATVGGARPDRMATSHTRARGFVYDAVKNRHPVPFGGDAETQEAWKQAVIDEAVTRFRFAVKITYPDYEEAAAQQNARENAESRAPQRQPAGRDQQGGEVRQIASGAQARPKPLVEGEEGFVAPETEVLTRFGALASSAGFDAVPDGPVSAYLSSKFGVDVARKVNGADLDKLVTWYENQGEAGSGKFRQHVLAEAGEPATDQPTEAAEQSTEQPGEGAEAEESAAS